MISVEDARERILAFFERLEPEQTPVIEALGQVLAENVVAGFDIPPLDNTAMDGYAVRAADTDGASEGDPRTLTVIADLAAGYVLDTAVGEGEAVRIMTGAPIPPGADAIVPFEETDEPLREPGQAPTRGDSVGVFKAARLGANIRRRGEDIETGQAVLEAGRVMRASEIGVLSSIGRTEVSVYRRPEVAILSTGDEIVTPGEERRAGQIYDAERAQRGGARARLRRAPTPARDRARHRRGSDGEDPLGTGRGHDRDERRRLAWRLRRG